MKRKLHIKGFTTVELLISVTLFTIIVGMSVTTFISLGMAASVAGKYSEMGGDIRLAMDRMTKDIRMAENVRNAGVNFIRLAVPYTTVTQDVWYIESSDKLYRFDNNGYSIIAHGTDNIDIDLYDVDGNPTGVASNAVSVNVTLSGDARVLTAELDGVVQTRILLRNKKL